MSESDNLEDRVAKQEAGLKRQEAAIAQTNNASLSALNSNVAELTRLLTNNRGGERAAVSSVDTENGTARSGHPRGLSAPCPSPQSTVYGSYACEQRATALVRPPPPTTPAAPSSHG